MANKWHPTFTFCGTFSGTGKTSGARWLEKVEHELYGYEDDEGNVPPKQYLKALNMLLVDDAADWAESNSEAPRYLKDPAPTRDTVRSFQDLFNQRFRSQAVESTPVPFDVDIAELTQKSDESLITYYRRALALL